MAPQIHSGPAEDKDVVSSCRRSLSGIPSTATSAEDQTHAKRATVATNTVSAGFVGERRWPGDGPDARLLSRSTPSWRSSAATAVGLLYAFGGVGCLLGAAFPMGPQTPIGLSESFGIVGVVVGPTLIALRRRVTITILNAALCSATVLVSVLVSFTGPPVGVVLTGVFYMCIALIAAYFLTALQARAHSFLAVSGFSAGVLASGVPRLVVPWFVITVAVLGAAELLRRVVAQLRRQAALDPLTGLANRAYFRVTAERELALACRSGTRFSIALLDLDEFKAVNDTYGHVAGDALLSEIALAWQAELRRSDLMSRYGGDEFALIMPDTDHDEALHVVERLRGAHPAEWSVGVATWDNDVDLKQLLQRTDSDLYNAKNARAR